MLCSNRKDGGDLPNGYVKQTYIGCLHRSTVLSGSELNNYFVTPLNGTANDIIRTRFMLKEVSTSSNIYVYGNAGGGSQAGISLYANVSDGYFYMSNGWNQMKLCQFQYDTEYEVEHSYTYIIINGTRYNNSSARLAAARGYYLLTRFNTNGGQAALMKYFSIEREGSIVSNLVACKNMSTGMNQFYDTVRGAELRAYYTKNNRELAIDSLGPE